VDRRTIRRLYRNRLRHSGGLVLHEDGINSAEFVRAAGEAYYAGRHANERSRWRR
jgi:hypothetical protein